MASPNILPHYSLWLRRPTGLVASIDEVTQYTVKGHIQYGDGLPSPFEARHDHESFQVGDAGPRFYFKDWKKAK